MKDIEDRLKEEYDKVEVPDYMFDTSRVFKRIKKEKETTKKIVIASIIVILLIVLIIIVIPKGNNYEKINVPQKAEQNDISIVGNIELKEKNNVMVSYTNNQLICMSLKIEDIEDYKIINNIPYTIIKANIINSYLGDISGKIQVYVPGGIFKVKDLKEKVKMKAEDISELLKFSDEDFIEVTYYSEVFIPIAKENNTYIATLYMEENKYFVDINKAYGFKEYNPETNIVKDDTGDEPLQIDKYLENITK